MFAEDGGINKPKVLVVDDNALLRNVLCTLLSEDNFSVETASNGHEALDVLSRCEVDLILCD
ncbi:MAG: response regulator, partial [Candidatus Dadabacteria bacterium]